MDGGLKMMRRMFAGLLVGGVLLFAGVTPARATDGHFLHGVGAVNNAMGGAGVAAPVSILGTFYLNPAGLIAFDGLRVEFSFEMFKPDRTVASGVGPFTGSTVSKSEFTPIPAMGFSYKINDKWAVGLGGLGIGGFGVDYQQDSTNPVLGPRPLGFGQVFSSYSLLKFTPAVAFAPSDKISLGLSANVAWVTLTVDPAPFASPYEPRHDLRKETDDDQPHELDADEGQEAPEDIRQRNMRRRHRFQVERSRPEGR
mgnify:CR=1 FL=1